MSVNNAHSLSAVRARHGCRCVAPARSNPLALGAASTRSSPFLDPWLFPASARTSASQAAGAYAMATSDRIATRRYVTAVCARTLHGI
jgi:hypothetical protein